MRKMAKLSIPEILEKNHENWLTEYLEDKSNATKRYRYRAPEIKQRLKEETGYKCVYCESSIGHNTPGDIEHKIPTSKNDKLHFIWENLTIACSECNRRKNDYYNEGTEFLDPYTDDVENLIEHHGPLVLWKSGQRRAEISIRILKLNDYSRSNLIIRKIQTIDDFNHLLERYLSEQESVLKKILGRRIKERIDRKNEYSGMLKTLLDKKGIVV